MRAHSLFALPPALPAPQRLARRHALLRLGVAWLAMMQAMMFAWPGYVRHEAMPADALSTLDRAIVLMNWASLLVSVPVVLYCAWPVWAGAWRSLRHGRAGMDVPEALGILAAFLPSARATWLGHGAVYFDSVTMFVAFLLSARYLDLCARQASLPAPPAARTMLALTGRALSARADRVAARFVMAQVLLALGAGLAWMQWDPARALPVMVALLVMSCPCAMAMAVPAALAAAYKIAGEQACARPAALARLRHDLRRNALGSLYGSLAWHLLMAPLALAGWVAPWLAALTMFLSSMAVAGHAWWLYRRSA